MNVCILSGRLSQPGVVRGTETKVLAFTLETKSGGNNGEKNERTALVPCVMFNPPPKLEGLLTSSDGDVCIELQGRVETSSFEARGERHERTEVIVFNKTVAVVKP